MSEQKDPAAKKAAPAKPAKKAAARTRPAAKKAAPAKPATTTGEPKSVVQKSVVEEVDHAAVQHARLNAEADMRAATQRAEHVEGLRTEKAYLEQQPTPNKRRIAEVDLQLERYADKPARRGVVETA